MSSLENSLDSNEWLMISKSEESGAEKIPMAETLDSPSFIGSESTDLTMKDENEPDCDDGESIEKLSHESLETVTDGVFQGNDMDVKSCISSMASSLLTYDESDSSDVDVLDEIEEEDVTKQARQFPHFPVVRRSHSVGVMTQDLCADSTTKCSGLMSHITDLVEKIENRLHSDQQLAYGILLLITSVAISTCSFHLICSYTMGKPENLAAIEGKIFECLGRQYVKNMGCSRQILDFSEFEGVLCMDEDNHYTDLITNSLMDSGTRHFLSKVHAQLEKGGKLPQVKWHQRDVNLSLILRHFEFKNIFPRVVYGFTPEKLKEIERKRIANAAFREVLDEAEEIVQPIQDVTKHLPPNSKKIFYKRVKDELVEHVLNEEESAAGVSNEENAEFNTYMNRVREAKEKIRGWLKNKSQIMGLSGSILGPKGIEKIEENLNKVKTLPGIFENFQKTLSDAVSNMQNVNDVIKNVLNELDKIDDLDAEKTGDVGSGKMGNFPANEDTADRDGSDWSWENFRKTTENTINDWKKTIERKHERIRKVGYYEYLKFYLKRERETMANALNTVKGYFKTSTDEKQTDPTGNYERAAEDPVSEKLEWSMLPTFLKQLIDSSSKPKTTDDTSSSDLPKETQTDSHSDTLRGEKNPKETHNEDDSKSSVNDWLFKRAVGREENRETLGNSESDESETNWFLRRKRI